MRAELAELHDRLRVTTVYVTHDQVEAMTLGQRVAVLRDGLLQQVDTPQILFHEPVNLFVAAFIGSPDEGDDAGKLFADDRAVFTAVLDARHGTTSGSEVELAVDSQRLHFFDPATGLALAGASRSSQLVP
jgi:ABC-type sugar transport system ATPase subunit